MANRSDDWRAQAVNLAASATAGTVMLKFSRNDEKAADRDGVRLLEQAGYDPRGLLEFMEMLDAQQKRSPNAVARFLSTHPAPRDRVRDLTALVGNGGGRRDSPEFARPSADSRSWHLRARCRRDGLSVVAGEGGTPNVERRTPNVERRTSKPG